MNVPAPYQYLLKCHTSLAESSPASRSTFRGYETERLTFGRSGGAIALG